MDSISARLRKQHEIEESLRLESLWQRLMFAKSADVPAIAAGVSANDAATFLKRLNAAPGDNPAVRRELEAK